MQVKVIFGNDELDEIVRDRVRRLFGDDEAQYAGSWTMTSAIISELNAYIVHRGTHNSLVTDVQRFSVGYSNFRSIRFVFKCSSHEMANEIAQNVEEGTYEIKVAFYISGFNQVSTNAVLITARGLQEAFSETLVDGSITTPEYIHRNQVTDFASKFNINVSRTMYVEDPTADTKSLTEGLEQQFAALHQQGRHPA